MVWPRSRKPVVPLLKGLSALTLTHSCVTLALNELRPLKSSVARLRMPTDMRLAESLTTRLPAPLMVE